MLNVLDIVIMINIILEQVIPTEYEIWASDYNGDDEINIIDIVLVINSIMD